MNYKEERLNRDIHFQIVGNFQCGADDPLNLFLSDKAFEYDEERYGTTYLLRAEEGDILAFYSIKANGVQICTPMKEYNAVPVVEIARIAVEFDFQNMGMGKILFYDYILPKIEKIESLIAIRWIIVFVDPFNVRGIKFYESLGFIKAEEDVQKRIGESFNEDCDLYILELKQESMTH